MKTLLLAFALFIVGSTYSYAQGPIAIGQSQLNVGIGLSSWGLPIYGGLDYGVHKDITVGGQLSYRSYSNEGLSASVTGISGNANYHFNSILKLRKDWNFYAGISLGYFNWSSTFGSYASGLRTFGQVGVRYYFNNSTGINFEAGLGSFSEGKLGVSFKL